MATVFDVTPEELEASAAKVEGKAQEFTNAYENIYTAVSDLRVTFKGQTSDTFNQRITDYRNTFASADKTLTKYVSFLREYASEINNTETNLKGKAGSLSSG